MTWMPCRTCECEGGHCHVQEAIDEAVSDLMDAIEGLLQELTVDTDAGHRRVDEAKAALAKARGETQS